MSTMNQVLEYVANSETVNKTIKNIISKQGIDHLMDDFKSFFILEIAKMSEEKLVKAYNEGWIDGICIKTIVWQLKSSTSKFYRDYRRDWKNISVNRSEMTDDMYGIMTDSRFTDVIASANFDTGESNGDNDNGRQWSFDMMDSFYEPENNIENPIDEAEEQIYQAKFEKKGRAKRVISIVNELYPYDVDLWADFFVNQKSYKQIEAETGIKYASIYDNIMKTNRYIIKRYREEYGLNGRQEKYVSNARRLQPKKSKNK